MNRGFTIVGLGGDAFAAALRDGRIKLEEVDTTAQNLRRLQLGFIDFYLNGDLLDISAYPEIIRGPVVLRNWGHLGFALKSSEFTFLPEFETQFNMAIRDMIAAGRIDAIVEAYLSRNRGP